MEGAEVINSQNCEPVPDEVSTASLYVDNASGTHRIAFDKKIREHPSYRLVDKVVVKISLMHDGEIRIKKLSDTV